MDTYDHRRRHHPSFSSTLLDQIYRSIDNSDNISMINKNHHHNRDGFNRRPFADDFFKTSKNPKKTTEQIFFKHSSSSSSDSSGFSSSESDSYYNIRSRSSRSPPEIPHPPKPIRTTTVERSPHHRPNTKQEHGGSFLRTKSKALKIYTDLKKVKQPISPGGRLATFLNSLFTGGVAGGNTKKPTKLEKDNTTAVSTSSSASSFSRRSCLSKTTSSSSSEKSKRSVRFCPVNVVILDNEESSRHDRNFDVLDTHVMEENRRVIEAAKELLRTFQKNKDIVVDISGEEDDDDDVASCASSDLFELENLSEIGIERYREELPVYETTCLDKNRLVSR